MADPEMNAAISDDLMSKVASLTETANRVCGDRRKVWIEISCESFRVLRAVAGHRQYEELGFGGTMDDAVRRAEDYLHDLHVRESALNEECDRLFAVQSAARRAAE